MNHLITLSLIILSYSYCNEKIASDSFNGLWQSIGHGEILEIKGDEDYAFYDITSISCVPRRKGSLDEITNALTLETDTLSFFLNDHSYRYTKVSSLSMLCRNRLDAEKANDPLYNFEVFMETVKEHYAFLELNGINWDELYQNQKAKLDPSATDADLYLLIEETYEMLNDNHAFLNASEDVYDQLDELYPEEDEAEVALPEHGDFPVAQAVAEHYLKEDMTKDSWLVHWGKITDDMGYIQLKSMWLFADLNLSQSSIDSFGYVDAFGLERDKLYEGDYMEKEVDGARAIMDVIMKDLKETASIIIDVRFNGGGQEVVSFEIASRFIQDRMQVANHKFRYGDQHTPIEPIYVYGSKDPYLKPVYVLTSPQSGSGAEVFSVATMSMPHVQRIGSATEGAMSTTLDKFLPNGWEFAVSNEVYMDNDGICYENIGIPVHYELNYPRDRQTFFRSVINDLEKDKRAVLEAVGMLTRATLRGSNN